MGNRQSTYAKVSAEKAGNGIQLRPAGERIKKGFGFSPIFLNLKKCNSYDKASANLDDTMF
jgi:hypothetical protein